MVTGTFSFDRFTLDFTERTLRRDDRRIELNSRYLDALALLVAEQGRLVSKERFLEEVWRGVPVTDEALTQCIRTLRRQLGDDAARPQFIETVPKHGYRFVANVQRVGAARSRAEGLRLDPHRLWMLGLGGTLGGAAAGVAGGLIYGFLAALDPLAPPVGAASVLVVLVCVTTLVALLGAAGVAFGIAATLGSQNRAWTIAGGTVGGLAVGAIVKLLSLDAFTLLLGRSPGDITGPLEGALIGAAVGLGVWLSGTSGPLEHVRRTILATAFVTGAAGALIVSFGGRMLGGSLELLERSFPQSHVRLDRIGHLFGEEGLGRIGQTVTAGLEGALFGAFVVGGMALALRMLARSRGS
jgi:DNA-binding winged helix-turn-helix (wHTH) protein